MNKRELIKAIKEGLGIDYKPISVGAGAVQLTREYGDSTNRIVFSYLKYPGEYIVSEQISGYKSIKEVILPK